MLYVTYLNGNNLYGWAMLQKLATDSFEWSNNTCNFIEDFIKHFDENIDLGYILEADINCLEQLEMPYNEVSYSPEKIKMGKYENFACNLNNAKC